MRSFFWGAQRTVVKSCSGRKIEHHLSEAADRRTADIQAARIQENSFPFAESYPGIIFCAARKRAGSSQSRSLLACSLQTCMRSLSQKISFELGHRVKHIHSELPRRTGRQIGDCVAMRWDDIDGEFMEVVR